MFSIVLSFELCPCYNLAHMPVRKALLIARAIHDIESRRRRWQRHAVCHLIQSKPRIIPGFHRRHRRVLPYTMSEFQLDDYPDDWCHEYLRFSRQNIKDIIPFLRLDLCVYRNRYNPSPEVAFCLVLYKLSWPHRLKDTLDLFGQSRAWQSSVFNDTVIYLVSRYRDMLY
jgi:hypothetical protein